MVVVSLHSEQSNTSIQRREGAGAVADVVVVCLCSEQCQILLFRRPLQFSQDSQDFGLISNPY